MAKIRLPAKMEHLEELLDFVDNEAHKAGFSARRISEIRLAAEEVMVNISCYAYPETDGDVFVSCFVAEGFFVLEILDSGTPFNIVAAPGPDVGSSCLSERYVGGLGIHFVKEMATETRYVRDKGQNRLTLIFGKYRQAQILL
ncbi:MAG: ATP-binding protein [Deltaproteobacteria bacterium]|nr:ATP-binding protein [Deltaproteobacteria bacterium]